MQSAYLILSYLALFLALSPAPASSLPNSKAAIDLHRREQKIYLIRHGEKPSDKSPGLSKEGKQRAKCITRLFGPKSKHNISYIIAPTPKKKGGENEDRQRRSLDTVAPLAKELGLGVDTSCKRDETDCVAGVVDQIYLNMEHDRPKGDILISWRHTNLPSIVASLGCPRSMVPEWPRDRFDLIWTMQDGRLISEEVQDCPEVGAQEWEGWEDQDEDRSGEMLRVQV